ncbi:hypothetical protein AAMO2058_000415900 [Amorphochlora amoebiformis]
MMATKRTTTALASSKPLDTSLKAEKNCGKLAQNSLLISTNPNKDAKAPSDQKRQRFMIVMRHSERLDCDPQYDINLLPEGSPQWEKAHLAWPDRAQRPYDTPICDFQLPATEADKIREKAKVEKLDVIISSPFRRCLQTAAVLAREFKTKRVRICNAIGEVRRWVRAQQRNFLGREHADGKVKPLTKQQVESILKDASKGYIHSVEPTEPLQARELEAIFAEPDPEEDIADGRERILEAVKALYLRHCKKRGESIIAVTHGGGVLATIQGLTQSGGKCRMFVSGVDVCGWAAFTDGESMGQGLTLSS